MFFEYSLTAKFAEYTQRNQPSLKLRQALRKGEIYKGQ